VNVEKLNSAATIKDYRSARSALERRWSSLLSREVDYRATSLVSIATA
jgi:hypothetical protein